MDRTLNGARREGTEFQNRVRVFDTTLRDGEQTPGIQLLPEKKLKIALALEDAGCDIIEAGFPVSGDNEKEAVRLIAREVSNAEVAVLCRPIPSEIDLCEDVLSKCSHPRLHLWIATSPIHMKHKLNMTPLKVMEKAIGAIHYAAGKFETVQFSSEDATRSNIDFLNGMMREAVRSGAHVVNLADTVGCALPEHVALMVREVRGAVKDRVPVGIHCHNDLGLATSNTISAIRAGARQMDVTVTGVGERAGNASLEQIAVALDFHSKHLKVRTGMDLSKLGGLCDLVISEMKIRTATCQPLIGMNSFRHESGIHIHGMLNNPMTYEVVDPKDLGMEKGQYVLGKHSGKAAVGHFLARKGLELSEEELTRLTDFVKENSLVNGSISNEDELLRLAQEKGIFPKQKVGDLKGVGGEMKDVGGERNGA